MDWAERIVSALFGLLMLAAFLVVGAIVYHAVFSEKIHLIKHQWHCTASHTETRPTLIGKVMVPQTTTVCDRYERR